MTTKERCGTCHCFLRDTAAADKIEQAEGLCRRFPPAVVMSKGEPTYRFPRMTQQGWCGEWRIRLEPTP